MHQRLAPEASEDRFRKFSAELLAAEEVGFREGYFYSPDALRMILERFCNIIAENLHVQSCTIQLKLYDSFNSPLIRQLLESEGKQLTTSDVEKPAGCSDKTTLVLWENFSRKCIERYYKVVGNDKAFRPEQMKFRQDLLKNSMIFPYALYPKGALWLVASNEKGPWAKCAPWLISEISRGIMTQIIQDKAARVRDRMSLRQTRSHRKLGPVDPYIWTNQFRAVNMRDQSPLYFFNYYGVPIRIHQRGDVIGILRVENKGLGAKAPNTVTHRALRRVLKTRLPERADAENPAENIAEKFAQTLYGVFHTCKENINEEFETQDISLLSLVYLAYDLESARGATDRTVRHLCMLPYPATQGWEKPNVRPPIQITFDNSEEERAFVNWLTKKETKDTNTFRRVKNFYRALNQNLSATFTSDVNEVLKNALPVAIHEARKRESESEKYDIDVNLEAPSLLRKVRLSIPNEVRFVFYLQVTPTQEELTEENLTKYWGFSTDTAAKYCRVNKSDFELTPDDFEFHLPTDRLAARIEALTFAFPIPKFTIHDAWWLSWAALEVGKLIERQISYRGTNLFPTVPLTAMDFFRVPISDLSFVDALRKQYKAAETVQGMLEYHIPNHCRELDLEVTLEHHCRVKNFRSYLERLGEEHRAYYDALIATWLYMLGLRLTDWTESDLRTALDKHKKKCKGKYLRPELEDHFSSVDHCEALYEQTAALLTNLKSFYKALESVCASDSVLFTRHNDDWLRSSAPNVFGDLRFAVPNVEFGKGKKETRRMFEDARRLVMTNLRASPQALAGKSSPPGEDEQMDEDEISEYVFRRYDPFVTQCISFYILLTNVINEKHDENGYKSFYMQCRKLTRFLREKFESSHRLNETWSDISKLLSATKSLSHELSQLRAKISELSTTDFSSVMDTAVLDDAGPKERESASDAYLTVKGIYKRVRTLINIAGNQVCPPLLNWETSRFDYVGARINCLFKNQVFAIYEHLWNRGDPFSHWTSGVEEDDEGSQTWESSGRRLPIGGHPRKEDEGARQRWLSIQTKIHKGEEGYNAWQISALLDPRAVLKGYYYSDSSLYHINALRDYLVLAFEHWHNESAEKYHDKAKERSRWQEEYCRWFQRGYITHVLRKDPISGVNEHEHDVYFPEYLLRTPLDIFIHLLETDLINKRELKKILKDLHSFIRACSNKKRSNAERWAIGQRIYESAGSLVEQVLKRDTDKRLSPRYLEDVYNALKGQLPALEEEKSRFGNNFEKWPDLKAFTDETLSARLTDMRRILKSDQDVSEIWRKGLRHVLIELQSSQKQNLFDIRDLRSSQNVLDRILCYVLLFDSENSDEKVKDWSAHDLFYYVASLIPAEIQVRTTLSDTMAEQYHGVYKSNVDPAHSVAVQRRRLQEMGRKLDDLDRETEAIYDGYIVHSMLHAKKLNAERND